MKSIPLIALAIAALLLTGPAGAATDSRTAVDLVVTHARVLTVDGDFRVFDDGAVATTTALRTSHSARYIPQAVTLAPPTLP